MREALRKVRRKAPQSAPTKYCSCTRHPIPVIASVFTFLQCTTDCHVSGTWANVNSKVFRVARDYEFLPQGNQFA